jgi:thioredoxin reductase (NADPH)
MVTNMTQKQQMYDIAIIGAGVTGLAAAMYAGRMKLKTILIGFPPGGTIATTDWIENYPGFISLSGKELADKITAHAMEYDIELVNDTVTEVTRQKNCFVVHTAFSRYATKTMLFATGTRHRRLPVPGADRFEGKGVQFCGLCDGPLYQDKTVAVVGGGDSAAKEALILAQFAKKVYILVRGAQLRGEPVNNERVARNGKIVVIPNTEVMRIDGDTNVRKVILSSPYRGSKELVLDAVFVAIGSVPMAELAAKLGAATNETGEILINRRSETNIPGLYAAGDVTDTEFKQAITGVAEGVTAVYHAYKYVTGEFVCTCIDLDYLDCPGAAQDLRRSLS